MANINQDLKDNVAVLVLSYDGNSDMWPTFFQFFQKYWPDNPYRVYLSVNELDFSFPGVEVIKSGKALDWSSDLLSVLNQIQEEYLIILLEDYFIYKPVDNKLLEKAVSLLQQLDAGFLRLGTFPARYNALWPSEPLTGHPGFNIVSNSASYLVNLQAGIWRKSIMKELLVPGESPWSFEVNATIRYSALGKKVIGLDAEKGVGTVHGPIIYLCGALTRGVLMRSAVRLAAKENIALETGNRKVETALEELGRNFYIALPLPARKFYNAIRRRITVWKKK